VAAWSEAWSLFAHFSAGIVGSNLTEGMDVCVRVYSVCVVLCVGSGLATGWSLAQGVIPTVNKNDYDTEEEGGAQQRAVEPLMNEMNE
jgi:hypothetical protein